MPNHVTSVVEIRGPEEEILRWESLMLTSVEDGRSGQVRLDFDKLIPMPPCLDPEKNPASSFSRTATRLLLLAAERGAPYDSGGLHDHQIEAIRRELRMPGEPTYELAEEWLRRHPEEAEHGRNRLRAILETGCATWYEWCVEKWGTKWGAYCYEQLTSEPGYRRIRFDTAWDFPLPVMLRIAREFPGLKLSVWCHDEGDNFAGEGEFSGHDYAYAQHKRGEKFSEIYHRIYGETLEERDRRQAEENS